MPTEQASPTRRSAIRLLEHDPDLAALIEPSEHATVAAFTQVAVELIPPGTWAPREEPAWGLLVLDGMLIRELQVAGETAAELLGPGDVLQRRVLHHPDPLLPTRVTWIAAQPSTVAWLGDRFGAAARRWPQLAAALLERSERRSARLAVAQAISHIQRVDRRVHVLLWHLAERWGRVGKDGVLLPLNLTHRTVGLLVGARRPTVTSAFSELARADMISRRDDGVWVLRGGAPAELLEALPGPHSWPAIDAIELPETPATVSTEALRAAYREQAEQVQAVSARSARLREESRTLVAELRRLRETAQTLSRPAG